MKVRTGTVIRKTKETDIEVKLSLDQEAGVYQGASGIGFLDHMLDLFAKHSGFQLNLKAKGDLHVDEHHTVEDIALCLGKALNEALGDKLGIMRYASLVLPMDETLVLCAVDISGRPGFYADMSFPTEKIGQFDSQLVPVFWQAFTTEAKITLHVRQFAGENSHHLAEAMFKGIGRVLKAAVKIEGEELPSTKGVL